MTDNGHNIYNFRNIISLKDKKTMCMTFWLKWQDWKLNLHLELPHIKFLCPLTVSRASWHIICISKWVLSVFHPVELQRVKMANSLNCFCTALLVYSIILLHLHCFVVMVSKMSNQIYGTFSMQAGILSYMFYFFFSSCLLIFWNCTL